MAEISAQIHYASAFAGPHVLDRFSIGQKINWLTEDHKDYQDPIETSQTAIKVKDDAVEECCYSECGNCGASLYAIVKFKNFFIEKVTKIGLQSKWPRKYGT